MMKSPKCPVCDGSNMIKKGMERTESGFYQRYKCKDCDKHVRPLARKPLPGGVVASEVNRLMAGWR